MTIPRLVNAQRFVRKMRGSCHAHLTEADDQACYVVKFAQNPQGGRRTLINEMLASLLFEAIGVATPEVAYVAVDSRFVQDNPDVSIACGNQRTAVEPGLHFGSRCPEGDKPVYDFLPDRLFPELYNRRDFLGALAMDKWLSNGDSRQAVFYRDWIPKCGAARWVVRMIDHGGSFQGREWTFRNSPAQGVYARRAVYGDTVSLRDFEPWLDAISDLRFADLEEAFHLLPGEWIGTDEANLRGVLKALDARRCQTRAFLAETVGCFWGRHASHSSLVLKFCAFP